MEREEERITPEQQRMLSLGDSVRNTLRRNEAIKLRLAGIKMTDDHRQRIIIGSETDTQHFLETLQTLLLYMTEEEACDYLEGLKHIITG